MVMKRIPAVEDGRLLAAAYNAPVVEGTPEEMAAFEEGLADIRAGRNVSAEQMQARLRTHAKE